jgi:hypothetical protein
MLLRRAVRGFRIGARCRFANCLAKGDPVPAGLQSFVRSGQLAVSADCKYVA